MYVYTYIYICIYIYKYIYLYICIPDPHLLCLVGLTNYTTETKTRKFLTMT